MEGAAIMKTIVLDVQLIFEHCHCQYIANCHSKCFPALQL